MKGLELTFFSVTPEGVIIVPDIPEPEIRSDVFEQVDPSGIHSCRDLIELIESCPPLEGRFQDLSAAYLKENSRLSSTVDHLVAHRSGSQQLILRALRRNPDGAWRQWIEYSGDAVLEEFLQHVHDWLDEDIDWNESDHFDGYWNGQQAAFTYFDDLPYAILKAVGIKVIDGDVPGSNFRAAKLQKSVEEANQMAELLEQEFRFEQAAVLGSEVSHV